MNKRDIRMAELAADLLSPPPEIINAERLRDAVDYLMQKRGLRKPSEIVAAIRRFKWASVLLQRSTDIPSRIERMARGEKHPPAGLNHLPPDDLQRRIRRRRKS